MSLLLDGAGGQGPAELVSLPLQLDSSHAEALERGLRVYNGKPIVNSVNGEAEKLNTILPLCKKVRRRRGWSGTG